MDLGSSFVPDLTTTDEQRSSYAMKANIIWEVGRSIRLKHPMLRMVPGSTFWLPTLRMTPSAYGNDTPKDVVIMINEKGNLLAYSSIQRSVFLEVDLGDPKSLDKISRWVIKRMINTKRTKDYGGYKAWT